jgi:hypothetical protein
VISFALDRAGAVRALAEEHGVPLAVVGSVGCQNGEVRITVGTTAHAWSSAELRKIYFEAIPRRMALEQYEGVREE